MKKALLNPKQVANHIIGWSNNSPIYGAYTNGVMICEVAEQEFDVAPPLYWVDCEDDVISYQYYYDTVAQTINLIEDAISPTGATQSQPTTNIETI